MASVHSLVDSITQLKHYKKRCKETSTGEKEKLADDKTAEIIVLGK
jgi:hypothetical protein